MSFIDSYKHLEKLCGEVLNDSRRVTAYIEEMQNTPRGAFYVPSWNDDLKKLKHYRWVRNQIAHEPNCNEQNMCDPDDALWLDQFHARIMNQTAPLALYRKATTPRTTQQSHRASAPPAPQSDKSWGVPKKPVGCAIFLFTALLILLMIAFFLMVL